MFSLRELYRIGTGPSSSHTMAPKKAAEIYAVRHPDAENYRVTLYASLAATGRGHLTDIALKDVLGEQLEIVWLPEQSLPEHPNGMLFQTVEDGNPTNDWTVYSVGGGALKGAGIEGSSRRIYQLTTMHDILENIKQSGESFWEFVFKNESPDIKEYLANIWRTMQNAIDKGINSSGLLPGGLGVSRKAQSLHRKLHMIGESISQNGHLASYAYAVAEENACGGVIVTAPTCGASGVLPSVLKYMQKSTCCSDEEIINALARMIRPCMARMI
jgi:L-serine dehydratase